MMVRIAPSALKYLIYLADYRNNNAKIWIIEIITRQKRTMEIICPNKKLDLNSWRYVFYSYDVEILYIKITSEDDFGEVTIYNIYNLI